MSNGEGGGFDPGQFFGGLGDLFSSLLAEILSVLEFIWNVLVAVATFLYDVILATQKYTLDSNSAFGDILHKIKLRIWDGVLVTIIDIIRGDLYPLIKVVKKIIAILQRIRDWYFKHIFPILFDILEVIATLRLFLEVLRLLHVKWAAKLDQDLQKVQGYITASIVDVVKNLNRVTDILGIMVDPGMLIRGDAMGRSLWNALGQLKKAIGFGSARPVYPDEQKRIDAAKNLVTGPGVQVFEKADGTATLDPLLQEWDGQLTQATQTLGLAH